MNLRNLKLAYKEWCGYDLPENCNTKEEITARIIEETERLKDDIECEAAIICSLYLNTTLKKQEEMKNQNNAIEIKEGIPEPGFKVVMEEIKAQLSYLEENALVISKKLVAIDPVNCPEQPPLQQETQAEVSSVMADLWACVERISKSNSVLRQNRDSLTGLVG